MDIVVLSQNPFWQVMAHPVFVDHDPSGIPAYVPNRRQVSARLVRPSDDISILHQINSANKVSKISIAPTRFPFTHKRISTLVVWLRLPRNDLLEVRQNPSLQTKRDKIISAQVSYKQLYIYDPLKSYITSSKVM